jgi:serine/threonine protein kinase
MDLTVENICGLIIRSRLLPRDAVKRVYRRWLGETKDAADLGQFVRWLVAQQYLSEYQAGQISRGRADGFFLDDYKIVDRLSQGRMAGVYKAVHPLGQVVAIKLLPASRAKDPEVLARFQREAQLAVRLKHPHVVRTFQVGEAGGVHYLVMEYLEGETLDEVLKRRGKLPPAEGVRLIHQALLGLQYIHEEGMVHRDLKPGNLMLVGPASQDRSDTTLQARVKILDIGLGRAMFDEAVALGRGNEQLTAEGAAMGTPDYMPPEQARDAHSVDIRADIYSLGCVLYHALAGQPPFRDTNLVTQMIRHATEPARPLREFNADVPDGLQQILNWMMAKDPKDRYPTPERTAQALQVFLAAGAEPQTAPEGEPRLRSYLSWLESKDHGAEAKSASASGAGSPKVVPTTAGGSDAVVVPAEKPLKPIPVLSGRARSRSSKSGHKHHVKKIKHAARAARTEQGEQGKPADDGLICDVELVPALPWQEIAISVRGLVLSRRDLLMLGIGAGSVAAAGLIGMAVAQISRRRPKREPKAPTDQDQEKDASGS